MHFVNQLQPEPQGFRFTLGRKQGPSLNGRIYFGITKTFD